MTWPMTQYIYKEKRWLIVVNTHILCTHKKSIFLHFQFSLSKRTYIVSIIGFPILWLTIWPVKQTNIISKLLLQNSSFSYVFLSIILHWYQSPFVCFLVLYGYIVAIFMHNAFFFRLWLLIDTFICIYYCIFPLLLNCFSQSIYIWFTYISSFVRKIHCFGSFVLILVSFSIYM